MKKVWTNLLKKGVSKPHVNKPTSLKGYIKCFFGTAVSLVVIYVLAVGLISSPSSTPYKPAILPADASDHDRATVMAQGVTYALDDALSSSFGFQVNDLLSPWIMDNTVNYQRGIIYATRPVSDSIAKYVARYGQRDTIDQRLADATSRYFSYSENVWGFWFVYDAESKYKAGIKNWASWAQSVGATKNPAVYNMKSDDSYNIVKNLINLTDYALGVLNESKVSHFKVDDNIYFVKGICVVVGNVFRAMVAADPTFMERGGADNVKAALERFDKIENFNPLYTMAGGNDEGDTMLPNHIAALARHLDIADNRLNDILNSMSR